MLWVMMMSHLLWYYVLGMQLIISVNNCIECCWPSRVNINDTKSVGKYPMQPYTLKSCWDKTNTQWIDKMVHINYRTFRLRNNHSMNPICSPFHWSNFAIIKFSRRKCLSRLALEPGSHRVIMKQYTRKVDVNEVL